MGFFHWVVAVTLTILALDAVLIVGHPKTASRIGFAIGALLNIAIVGVVFLGWQ